MRTSRSGIKLIAGFETFCAKSYKCPAGRWTIGYGHTQDVGPGMSVTKMEAEGLLLLDLKPTEEIVNRECPHVNQNQFDALVSFTFNLGERNLLKSTLLKCVKANPNNLNIRTELMRWNKANGEVLAGLTRRRRAEADLYFS